MVCKLHPSHISQWPYQLEFKTEYLLPKCQLHTIYRSWDTKGGCTLPSTHTILEKRCALVWLTYHCVLRVFVILCVVGVYDPLCFQLLDMGMKLNFFQGCPLLKDNNYWLMSKLQTRNLFQVVDTEIKNGVKS